MTEQVYTILYKKEILNENESYIFIPCYVIKGLYDEIENMFLDEINKFRYVYSDINIIQEQCNYCVGEIYTEEELRRKFPDANSIEDLQIRLFEEAENHVTIGKFNPDSTMIQIIKNYMSDTEYMMSNDPGNSLSYYEAVSQELGEFALFTREQIERLLSLNDLDTMKKYIKERCENRDLYEKEMQSKNPTETIYTFGENAINTLLNATTSEEIKEYLGGFYDQIEQIGNVDDMILDDIESIDIEDIINSTDKTYQMIMESNNKEEIKSIIRDLGTYYEDILEIIIYYQEQGYKFFKTATYLCSQIYLLNQIQKENNLLKLKRKYNGTYNLTRKNLEKMKSEFEIAHMNEPPIDPFKHLDEFVQYIIIEEKIDAAMDKLNHLVGLEDVKSNMEEIFDTILFQKKTEDDLYYDPGSKHMVFLGNPGTGKTTVAEIITPLFYELGYLENNKVAYIAAQDLIAQYVGQTAPKTEAVIKKNAGGLIVIDEAYILAGEAQHFGNEAVTVMLKEMEKNRTMFIFAGYKKEMEDFIRMNSGLESRIGTYLEFKDYSEEELFEIFKQNIEKVNAKENQTYQLTITEEAQARVKEVIKKAKEREDFGNGRFVKKLFDRISRQHAKNTRHNQTVEELYQITEADIPDNIMDTIFFGQENNSLYSDSNMGFNATIEKKPKTYEKSRGKTQTGFTGK